MSTVCVCVCVQLLKYNLTILVLVSTQSYSPSDQSLCYHTRLGPPFPKFWMLPCHFSLLKFACSNVYDNLHVHTISACSLLAASITCLS